MDTLLLARITALIVIALIYMLFDIFNRRNVPSLFAYATLAVGIVFTLLYLNVQTIEYSFAIAAIICGAGYIFYRIGQLGAADVIEFAAISLVLPMQPQPLLLGPQGISLPFVISVFIMTGVAALVMIPLYYLPRAKRILKKRLALMVTNKDVFKGVMMSLAYLVFIAFLIAETPLNTIGIAIIAIVMFSSMITAVFEKPITDSMVEYIPVGKFEEGDIIALNLMTEKEIEAAKRRIKGFDRLADMKLINQMKKLHIKTKFPVYRTAMPLALPIFIGVVVSILIGNVLLFIL